MGIISMNVIELAGVSKKYKMYQRPGDRLKEFFLLNRRQYHREHWAVRDVSLAIRTGEMFCIVGENGSGKSTLLKLMLGVLQPTAGKVNLRGRVTALIELGLGFNPEFTGRANVYMNGAILGLSKTQTAERLNRILDFAEIGSYIDQPVKTYSSGMVVRLAFAVAVHLDPDILIVDEALAVGVDLVGVFDGIGWGEVNYFAGCPARRVGPFGAASIFFRAPRVGGIAIAIDCVGEFVPLVLDRISISVNGEVLQYEEEIVDEHTARLRANFPGSVLQGTSGGAVLTIGIEPAQAAAVGLRSVTFRGIACANSPVPEDMPLFGEANPALAAAAGLSFHPPAEIDRLPGLAEQDLLLWRFGRDPLLYRSWLDHGGEPLRKVFESHPPGVLYPTPETQAWLDLLDRTVVEVLISGRSPR